MPKKIGTVYLVGAGPGDPGLITVKGKECLEKADVILFDYLVNPAILKKASVKAKLIDVGKRHKAPYVSQEEIEKIMESEAKKGKIVARLKGGDPFIFGRGGEEGIFLKEAGIPFEIVPGVSSFYAVPAYAGIPLTHRNLTADIAIVTGHEKDVERCASSVEREEGVHWGAAAKMGTVVILMALGDLRANLQKLVEHGKSADTPAAAISWGSHPRQKTVIGTVQTLADQVEREKLSPPSVIIVGEVVLLREKLKWFETKPLFNKKILITRSVDQGPELSEKLEALGGEVIPFPMIRIISLKSWNRFDRAIKNISSYQLILFTSVNSVDFFWNRCQRLKKNIRDLAHLKVAAIGPATCDRLLSHGLWVDYFPKSYHSKAMVTLLKKSKIQGKRILFPQARDGNNDILVELKKWGCRVDRIEAYRTQIPSVSPEKLKNIFQDQKPHWITFASSSAVENFIKIIGQKNLSRSLMGSKVACIGPVTRKTALSHGMKVDVMPRKSTLDGLVEAISRHSRPVVPKGQ